MKKFYESLTNVQKSLLVSILSIVLFTVSTLLSYSLFSGRSALVNSIPENTAETIPTASSAVTEDPKEPRTESCPLNGELHTKKAKENWQLRRPLAVMVENHTEARPQSGLSSADVVYEAVAEGGITRFMALFLCNLSDVQVGPVRSARTYFLDWLGEYDAAYAHVGGANTQGPADALGQIIKYGVKDMNQFSIGFPTFWRDYQRLGRPVATEHTMYSTTQKLWDVSSKRGWTNVDQSGKRWDDGFVMWKFKDSGSDTYKDNPTATSVNVNFWSGYNDYAVTWKYDGACSCYKRENGGSQHLDFDDKSQLSARNVIVQFAVESHANDGYENNAHLLYNTIGQGKALFFIDGKVVEGKWLKNSRTNRTKYLANNSREVVFNRGVIWIQTVPDGSKVNYQ